MVLEYLREGQEQPLIIEFNPWQWAGNEQLTVAYFNEVKKIVGVKDKSKKAKKAAQLLKAYSAFLSATQEVVKGIPDVLFGILAILLVAGAASPLLPLLAQYTDILTPLAGAGALIVLLLSRSQKLLDALAKRSEERAQLELKTLVEIKNELSSALRQLDRQLLVVIDDIDRLSPKEMREVFQLVKANADFPNFIYLLPFQRSSVIAANNALDSDGDAFLEKIVQVTFEIPPLDSEAVVTHLTEHLNALFAPELARGDFDHERWFEVLHAGLQTHFQNLRTVNRFVAMLAFRVEALRKHGMLEVNSIDFIALEVLREFEPQLFLRLRNSKQLLTHYSSGDQKDRDRIQQELEQLLQFVTEEKRESAKAVLRELFPNREWVFGWGSSSHSRTEWQKTLRICCGEYFDRYFLLQLATQEISAVEVERLFIATSDISKLKQIFISLSEQGRLIAMMRRIEPKIDQIAPEHLPVMLTALCSCSPLLPEELPDALSERSDWILTRLVRILLKNAPDSTTRFHALKSAISDASEVSLPVAVVAGESRRAETGDENELISATELRKLKDACIGRIREFANNGQLHAEVQLPHVLYRWKEWASLSEVQAWALLCMINAKQFLSLIVGFTHRSTVFSSASRKPQIRNFITLHEIESFVALSALKEALSQFEHVAEQGSELVAVECLYRAIERREAGKPDYSIPFDE